MFAVIRARAARHLGSLLNPGAAAPTVTVNGNAGTSATATLATGASDVAGTVNLTEGSGSWVAGAQFTVTFGTAYAAAPTVVLSAANTLTAQKWNSRLVSWTSTVNGFSVLFATAATTADVMAFGYVVVGA